MSEINAIHLYAKWDFILIFPPKKFVPFKKCPLALVGIFLYYLIMIFLKYQKGDLFENLENKKRIILLHSVNAKGVWGRGVAAIFAKKFPQAYLAYRNNPNVLGSGYIIEDSGFKIGCLVTSNNYGKWIDPPMKIVDSTYKAIKNLLDNINEESITIHSPKINFGLFKTPWELTEEAIKNTCSEYEKEIQWTVFEL